MIASQGSLATDSAVLKLSGKVFDKPFKGPVSLHTMMDTMPSFIECLLVSRRLCSMGRGQLMMPLWVDRLNQDRCSSYDTRDPREGEQV